MRYLCAALVTSAIALAPACDRVVNLTPLQDAPIPDAGGGIDALRGVDGGLGGLPDGGIGDGPGLPDATSTLDGTPVPSRIRGHAKPARASSSRGNLVVSVGQDDFAHDDQLRGGGIVDAVSAGGHLGQDRAGERSTRKWGESE